MKFEYPLSYTTIHNGNFENQLKQFCIDNKFLYPGIQWNNFSNGSHVLWTTVEWLKNRRYPTGEFVRYPDGSIKKDKKGLISKLRVFPSTITLNDAKEFLALEVLQELFINFKVPSIQEDQTTQTLRTTNNENES
jgi:hypothetical protein